MNDVQKQPRGSSERLLSLVINVITTLLILHAHRPHVHVHRAGETLYGSGACPALEEYMKGIEDAIVPLANLESILAEEYGIPAEDIDSVDVFDEAKSRASKFGKDDPRLEEDVRKLDKLHHLRIELSDLQHLGSEISCCRTLLAIEHSLNIAWPNFTADFDGAV